MTSRLDGKPTRVAPERLLEPLDSEIAQSQERSYDELLSDLERELGTPFFAQDGYVLYQNDCVDWLERFAQTELTVDLTITSPPYNIGKEYEEDRDLSEYLDWCQTWMNLVYDATASTGSFWLNLGYLEVPGEGKGVPIPYLVWNKSPFYLLQEVVWHYGAGVNCRIRFSPRNEKWLLYVKDPDDYTFNLDDVRDPNVKYPNQKKNGKLRCNPLGKNPGDVWRFKKVTSGRNRSSKERTDHPAQFPLAVVNRAMWVSSNPSDIILDPFAGSGTTGISAIGSGRVYVGIEKRKDYCEMAVERFQSFKKRKEIENKQQELI